MGLEKVISGGQTGADEAGVRAAKDYDIPTDGGYMPKGFRTIAGKKPHFAELYGMKEHSSYGYKERTYDNVLISDGTIIFAYESKSPGTRCTKYAIEYFNKPSKEIDLNNHQHIESRVKDIVKWIKDNNIEILNIAGNSERERYEPPIGDVTYRILCYVFTELGFNYVGR